MTTTVEPVWRRSLRCGNTTCVEVAHVGDEYWIRDSKNPDQSPLRLTTPGWQTFVTAIKDGAGSVMDEG